jgi:gas vesicle protein
MYDLEDGMKKVFSFISGMLTGAVVSGALVLLLTPESGEGVRNTLNEKIQRTKSDIEIAAQQKRKELENELARLRQS